MTDESLVSRERQARRWLGAGAFALGLLAVAPPVVLMAAGDSRFGFASTFLSELGSSSEPWVRTVFNSSLLLLAPVRLALLLVIAALVRRAGVARGTAFAIVGLAVVATLGGAGVAAVPYSLSETVHNGSAVTYYVGWIALALVLLAVAARHRMSAALAVTNAAVAVTSTVFLALVFGGYRPGTSGVAWPAALAEWCTYAALLSWVAAHALAPVEAADRRPIRASGHGGPAPSHRLGTPNRA